MNERIEKLAEQAGFKPFEVRLDDIKFEKFAELIVQRTLAIVEAHTEIFQSDQARAMVEHIKHSVKTDFGVEE
jgi:hypothetical protein